MFWECVMRKMYVLGAVSVSLLARFSLVKNSNVGKNLTLTGGAANGY